MIYSPINRRDLFLPLQDAKAEGPSFVEKLKKSIKRFVTNLAIDMACSLTQLCHTLDLDAL